MHSYAQKKQEHKSQSAANSSQKTIGSTVQLVDNRPAAIAQRKLQEMADQYSAQQALLQKKTNSTAPPIQLRRKAAIDRNYVVNVLGDVEDQALKAEFIKAWNLIIKSGGEAYFDDDIAASQAGYDPGSGKLILLVPEQNLLQWADTTLDKKAIFIHELTHIAEVMANTGSLHNMNYDMNTTAIKDTDDERSDEKLDALINQLNTEKAIFEGVGFSASSNKSAPSLYGFIRERLMYAGGKIMSADSNSEVPPVINQIIYIIDRKHSDSVNLKGTTLYKYLSEYKESLRHSRRLRHLKNMDPVEKKRGKVKVD